MRKAYRIAVVLVLLVVAACGNDGEQTVGQADGDSNESERVIAVDYAHDDMGSYHWRFFPRSMKARAGQTLVFERTYTGEPHSIVFGSLGQKAMEETERLDGIYADVDDDSPVSLLDEVEAKVAEAIEPLPQWAEYPNVAQAAAQPCYLKSESPPDDIDTPCTDAQQRQPEFTGKETYYSSGLIPVAGPNANEFRVKLADDIQPGTYRYYCAVHFPYMQGKIQVSRGDAPLQSNEEIQGNFGGALRALENPLRQALAAAREEEGQLAPDQKLPLPLAGIHAHPEYSVAFAAFIPDRIETKVNEPVTWTLPWAHTISFNAPQHKDVFVTDDDGTVRRDPEIDAAAGGSPEVQPVEFDLPRLTPYVRRPSIRRVDGGTWDGEGYFSSGLIGSEPYATYTLRVSKAGTYRFACRIHPRMRGTLVVG